MIGDYTEHRKDSLMVSSFKKLPNQLLIRKGGSNMSNQSYQSVLSGANKKNSSNQLNNSGSAGGILLPEKEIWRIFADMARAISHVHEKDFIHLDIKPTNFFVMKDRTVKLGDFGKAIHVSAIDSHVLDDDLEGDAIYMAPELLNKKFSQKTDIFSLGATLLEIASSINLPQNGPLWSKLRDGSYIQFSPTANRSKLLEDLINRMMAPDPDMRPPIDEIMMHPSLAIHMERNRFAPITRTNLPMSNLPK